MGQKIKFDNLLGYPWLIFFGAIFIWIFLAISNYYYQLNGTYTGTGILFPFSVIYPNQFLISGFLFAILFLITGVLTFKYAQKINIYVVFVSSVVLVIFGNLSQGDFDTAFLQPFYLKGRQYYQDAIHISNGYVWLRDFSKNLEDFQLHTKTHPPFITLLHYWILGISNIEILAITFFAIGCLAFPIFYYMLFYLGFKKQRQKWMLLLFAIIPSVNIYLLVSIDALVLTFTMLFLLGITRILYKNKVDIWSFILVIFGLLLTNLITFSGLFLFAFLGCISFYFLIKKNGVFVWLSLMATGITGLIFYFIYTTTGYDHIETFFQASHSENPKGFRLFYQPLIYFFTRIEDICEILIFLSFGLLAIIFSKKLRAGIFDDYKINLLFFSAISAITAMLLTGAYGTGETARACMFLVPYFLILLKNIEDGFFKILFYLCLFQTFGMQMIGNFFW